MGALIPITDKHELQTLLDDYSTDRPYLYVYSIEDYIWVDGEELHTWRTKRRITTRDEVSK